MPFFEDTGPRPEEERHPIWRSTALFGDQLERMLLLNLAWVSLGIPLLLAWAFPALPTALRYGMVMFSAVALIPATGASFGVLKQASDSIPISLEGVWDCLRSQVKPSFLVLLPLYSLFYWLYLLANFAAAQQILILDVLARLSFLLLGVVSLYWGPATAQEPEALPWQVLRLSIRYFWGFPGRTLVMLLAIGLAVALGLISIAGFFLVAPVLVALFQTQLYRSVARLTFVKDKLWEN